MDQELKQTLKDQFDALPKEIQSAILSVDYLKNIEKISKKYQMHIDQEGDFETETTLVMVGLEEPTDYIRNLKNALNMNDEQVRNIAQEVNQLIFFPIRDALRAVNNQKSDSTLTETIEVTDPNESDIPSRDELLKEIEEHHELIVQNNLPAIKNTEQSAPKESAVQNNDNGPVGINLPVGDIPKDVAEALKHIPNNPPMPVKPVAPAIQKPPTPKQYNIDPYREPIN